MGGPDSWPFLKLPPFVDGAHVIEPYLAANPNHVSAAHSRFHSIAAAAIKMVGVLALETLKVLSKDEKRALLLGVFEGKRSYVLAKELLHWPLCK
jgi:hypothetical protein